LRKRKTAAEKKENKITDLSASQKVEDQDIEEKSKKKETSIEEAFKRPRKCTDTGPTVEERLVTIEKALDTVKVRVSDMQISVERLVNLCLAERQDESSEEK